MSDQPAAENIDMRPSEGGLPARHFWWHPSRAIRRALFHSSMNVLLVFVPIGIASGTLSWPAETIFVLNFLAIIPLAPLITFSVAELSPSVGHISDGLMKAISGNAVEMIVRCRYPNVVI